MQIVIVRDFTRPYRGGNLNLRQLLNPLFFERRVKHPDRKRQRITRQRDVSIFAARKLKRAL